MLLLLGRDLLRFTVAVQYRTRKGLELYTGDSTDIVQYNVETISICNKMTDSAKIEHLRRGSSLIYSGLTYLLFSGFHSFLYSS